ncbi:primosomal protein N' [Nocardioides nanhaiensis]|uniref:Probable replication restart protein PriA n=1 Tax=Nocardioides nanhaiensis TaxID=1476871 RepID=A0ABP8X247_9ACTN
MTPEADPTLPGLARSQVRAARARSGRARPAPRVVELAEVAPVARVLVDVALAHLDRPFDYAVPATMAEQAQPGARVKVRFAGHDADGYVLGRVAASEHTGTLTPLRRVVSPEPVLSPAVAALAGAVAARYAGVRSDVLRLAVPPRHATAEKAPPREAVPPAPHDAAAGERAWEASTAGPAFLRHLREGGSPRAVAQVAPGEDWPTLLAHAAAATLAGGRGALLCVPDGKDLARLDAALTAVLGPEQHVALTAEAGPASRYRDFLAVSRGHRRIVAGTRAAAFAPVHDLGLVVVWDDGDDLHAEPRAPYPHTREVLLLRAELEDTAALVAGFARTVEADQLVRSGWARAVEPRREVLRARAQVAVTGASEHALRRDPHAAVSRLPGEVHALVREALHHGPVLVQTPRSGYALALACERCRTPVACAHCAGPLALTSPTTPPACRWCGQAASPWSCAECGAHGLRAPVLGDLRTAEELGRVFAPARVRTSSGDRVLARVEAEPAIVVATPGAEPVADGGYPAVVLLDTWLLLGRADLRAAEEALRRWANAAGLVRPGGRVLAVGDPGEPALQALVRWDPGGFAARESDQRRSAHLPPASRVATLTGHPGALDDALTLLQAPPGAEVLGPVPVPPDRPNAEEPLERIVVRVPRAAGEQLSAALGELQRLRSGRKLDPVRVQVDPLTF